MIVQVREARDEHIKSVTIRLLLKISFANGGVSSQPFRWRQRFQFLREPVIHLFPLFAQRGNRGIICVRRVGGFQKQVIVLRIKALSKAKQRIDSVMNGNQMAEQIGTRVSAWRGLTGQCFIIEPVEQCIEAFQLKAPGFKKSLCVFFEGEARSL